MSETWTKSTVRFQQEEKSLHVPACRPRAFSLYVSAAGFDFNFRLLLAWVVNLYLVATYLILIVL
jgi:hypothetical protein